MEFVVTIPATATTIALIVYLRSAYRTHTRVVGRSLVRIPDVAYAVTAALRGQPLLLVVCWSCLRDRTLRFVETSVTRLTDRVGIIESHDRLSAWWSHHVTYAGELARYEAYVPRHSYELRQTPRTVEQRIEAAGWRLRWASYDTQFWPCLATDGSAYSTVDVSTSIESFSR